MNISDDICLTSNSSFATWRNLFYPFRNVLVNLFLNLRLLLKNRFSRFVNSTASQSQNVCTRARDNGEAAYAYEYRNAALTRLYVRRLNMLGWFRLSTRFARTIYRTLWELPECNSLFPFFLYLSLFFCFSLTSKAARCCYHSTFTA